MQKRSKRYILLVAASLLLLLGILYVLEIKNVTHFYTKKSHDLIQDDLSGTKGGQTKTSDVIKTDGATDPQQPEGSSLTLPAAEQPAPDEPFPIENAHYRIVAMGQNSYQATLYAIINSPSQRSEYLQQLQQYKSEVIDYLDARFGTNYSVVFVPEEAENL